MKSDREYAKIHKASKVIVCIFNTLLLYYSTTHSMVEMLIIVNFTYFFGVNSVAYVLEGLLKMKHKHDKI